MLYFTERDGAPRWVGAIVSFDGFAPPPTPPAVAANESVSAFLAGEAARDAVQERLAAEYDAYPFSISLNPSGTLALFVTASNETAVSSYEVIDLVNDLRTAHTIEDGIALAASGAVWRDDTSLFIGYRDSEDDEGPIWGHLALLDLRSHTLTRIEPDAVLGQPPSVTPDGTAVYAVNLQIKTWRDGAAAPLGNHFALGALAHPGLSAPALSADGAHLIAIRCSGPNAASRTPCRYLLFDVESGSARPVVTFDAPPMGGHADSAVWNESGTWALVTPWTGLAEQQGLTLLDAARNETHFLGYESFNGRWVNDTLLIFDIFIFGERQTHLFDVTTQTRQRLLRDDV